MWAVAGEPLSIPILFQVEGEYVIPDADSVTLTVRNNAGAVMAGYNKLPFPNAASTGATVLLTDDITEIAGDAELESRFIAVDYTVAGVPHVFRSTVRLTAFLVIQATPQEVRDLIGAQIIELPDSVIDLYAAFFTLRASHPALSNALVSPTRASLVANKAIALQAALDTAPSWPARLMASESQDNTEYRRSVVDFAVLQASLERQLANELALLNALDTGGAVGALVSPLLILTNPADVITGN